MNESEKSRGFQFTDPRQQHIYDLLGRLIGPGPAAFFRDACWLVAASDELHAPSHLVSHCLREVESAIRDVLRPLAAPAKKVSKSNRSEKGRDGHRRDVMEILGRLGIPEVDPVAILWLSIADVGIAGRAHRAALDHPRPTDHEFADFWEKVQAILFEVLSRVERRFTEITGPLVARLLVLDTPQDQDAKLLKDNVSASPAVRREFFEKIGPSWLQTLYRNGFFKHPPPPEYVTQTHVRFPPWPLSQYLARMAGTDNRTTQRFVLQIALSIPRTDNASVRADLADIGLKLPTSLSVRLVPSYVVLLRTSKYLGYEPVIIGKLAVSLARQGRSRASLQLMSNLLAVIPDLTYTGGARENTGLLPRPRWRAYDWDRETLHNEMLPALVDASGIDALRVLARELKRAVDLSMTPEARRQRLGRDLSPIWLPSLTLFEETTHDVEAELVYALVTAAIHIIEKNPRSIRDVVLVLKRKRWAIFDRIRLHVLATTTVAHRKLIADALLDERLLAEDHVRVEYTGLLKSRYTSLRPRERDRLLEMLISRGLSIGEMKATSAEERQARRDRLIVGRLELIEEHLTASWKVYYLALKARTSTTIRWDEPNPTVEVTVGDRSPLDIGELKKLGVSEIVEYLRRWEPPESEWEASPDGLARALSVVAENDAIRFSENAAQFQGLDPTYVSWLIHGLDAALRAGTQLHWGQVMLLCVWVVSQPRDEVSRRRSRYAPLDPGWGWTRKAIATLISDGLRRPNVTIPIHLRDDVWNVLQALSDDPHPTPEDEQRQGGGAMDAYEFSINATRSEAVEGIIAYVLWVQESLIKTDGTTRTLDLVPEARVVLERHLDATHDPSRAVRAVYGRWFGNLYHADPKWTAEHVTQIFPQEREEQSLWIAAWEAFLWNRPHVLLYTTLRSQYGLALERMEVTVKRNAHTRDPRTRLGIHLSILFIRGDLPASDEHLVSAFFTNAPVDIRTAVIADVGRNLRQAGALSGQVIECVKVFWNLRLGAAGIADNSDLGTFGEWFASEQIDDDWTYPQLAAALSQGGKLQGGHNVIKKLAKDASGRTSQVLECLEQLLDAEKSEWHLDFWKDDIATVLRSGLSSALDGDRRRARETTNRLVARGYPIYKELLDPAQDASSRSTKPATSGGGN